MAEINIEKKGSPVWPWILGLALLLGVGWLVMSAGDDDEPVVKQAAMPRDGAVGTAGTAGTAGGAVPPAIQEYAAFANEPAQVGPDHDYTAEGIRRLSAALGAVVQQRAGDAETRNRFDRFKQSAERLQQDAQSTAHAGTVRDVFTSAIAVFESANIEAGDVSRLRQLATSISADRPLLQQTETVKQFFSQSAEALQRAAQRS